MSPVYRKITFTAEWLSCINHPCTAEVMVWPDDGSIEEVLTWSDGYSDYTEMSDKMYASLKENI